MIVAPTNCLQCGVPLQQKARGRKAHRCQSCRPPRAPRLPKGQRAERSLYFRLAHSYVCAAIRHGDLPKLDGSIACVDCGAPATEYDHRDYKKPMEVEPVCRRCNQLRGPGLHRDPTETGTKPLTIRKRFDLRAA